MELFRRLSVDLFWSAVGAATLLVDPAAEFAPSTGEETLESRNLLSLGGVLLDDVPFSLEIEDAADVVTSAFATSIFAFSDESTFGGGVNVELRCALKNDKPVDMIGDGPILAMALLAGRLCENALVLKLTGGGMTARGDSEDLLMSEEPTASRLTGSTGLDIVTA